MLLTPLMSDARREGRAEGRAKGRAEARTEIAKRMLNIGYSLQFISEATTLSIEQIEKLKAEHEYTKISPPPAVCFRTRLFLCPHKKSPER